MESGATFSKAKNHPIKTNVKPHDRTNKSTLYVIELHLLGLNGLGTRRNRDQMAYNPQR